MRNTSIPKPSSNPKEPQTQAKKKKIYAGEPDLGAHLRYGTSFCGYPLHSPPCSSSREARSSPSRSGHQDTAACLAETPGEGTQDAGRGTARRLL